MRAPPFTIVLAAAALSRSALATEVADGTSTTCPVTVASPSPQATAAGAAVSREDLGRALAAEACATRGAGGAPGEGNEALPGAAIDLAQRSRRLLGRRWTARAWRGQVQPAGQAGLNQGGALPAIGYVKVHKTGGSTMANIMDRLTRSKDLHVVCPTKKGFINWQDLADMEQPYGQYDMIFNHQIFNASAMRAYLRKPAMIFTLMREPLDMIDSKMRYHMKAKFQKQEISKGVLSWEAHLKHMKSHKTGFSNALARDLGWYGGLDLRRVKDPDMQIFRNDTDPKAIDAFIQQLDRNLDLVILTEYFDEGLVLLRRKLHLSLNKMSYLPYKVAEVKPDEVLPPTDKQRMELQEFLNVDQAIYSHFQGRFWRDWAAMGGYATLGSELEELRSENHRLSRLCEYSRALCPREFTKKIPKCTIHGAT